MVAVTRAIFISRLFLGIFLASCDKPTGPTAAPVASATPSAPATTTAKLVLDVVFSSEKKDWAGEAIAAFNLSGAKTDDGRPIEVKVVFTGSVEPIEGIVAETSKPHVFSPASSLVLPLLNDQWTGAKGGSAKPIVGAAEPLVLSPVVIAMWEPMAKALGWPQKKLGWSDIAQLAKTPAAWKTKAHPEWGEFAFGHTHPFYSNSGLIAVLAENYAAVNKTRDLEPADITAPKTMQFVRDIEGAIVHYGRSTGFFYSSMAEHGPSYLSAAVLYENVVVASAAVAQQKPLAFPLVCLYPKEGTQWADHPFAVLDAPWVGKPERDAAGKLRAYLMSRSVQESALNRYGFRPALTDIPLGAPIDLAHGADPKEPQTLLATPNARTIRAVLDQWKDTKRGVEVVIVFDRSGSMQGERMKNAREGLVQFLKVLRPTDRAVLLSFNEKIDKPSPASAPAELVTRAAGLFASGGTALYDAVLRGREIAESAANDKKRIHAVVVLTDGEDRDSTTTFNDLKGKLTPPEQGDVVRIFTIGYGAEANEANLKTVATQTGGVFYRGDPKNIKSIYDEIASFF